jgi:hypothetical protein
MGTYEIFGYFEEVWNAKTRKCLGTRPVAEQPGREFGTRGEQSFTAYEPLAIFRGPKRVSVNASPRKPIELFTRYAPLCGRLLNDKESPLTEPEQESLLPTPQRTEKNFSLGNKHTQKQKKDKTMKVKLSALRVLFVAIGFNTANNWDTDKCQAKLQKMGNVINDPEEIDPDSIKDKATRKTFDDISEAIKKEKEIEIEDDTAEASEKDEKPAKEEKASKKKPAKEDKEEESDEDEEEEDDEEEDKDEEESDEEEEKPAKKKKSPKDSGGKKDKFGLRDGTALSKLAGALTGKLQTQAEITEASGLKGTNYEGLGKLVKLKVAVREQMKDGGNGWKLKK